MGIHELLKEKRPPRQAGLTLGQSRRATRAELAAYLACLSFWFTRRNLPVTARQLIPMPLGAEAAK
jgi:hypothetical protein